MRAAVSALLLAISCLVSPAADGKNSPSVSPILDPEKEGQEMAERLRSSTPTENSGFAGVLEMTGREGHTLSIPIVSEIVVGPTNWQSVYKAGQGKGKGSQENLTIIHTPGRSNVYLLNSSSNALALNQPFAQSDFWLMDLGLEFFHWPIQRAIRAEMSRSRPCRVLESVDPLVTPGGYSKVLSWVDLETGAVLQAEAYDAQGKLLKKFALGPMQKVEGQYKLREMRIRNVQTRRQTELKFDLKAK